MRKVLLFLLMAAALPSFSQVQFQNMEFADALAQAKAKGKLVFLQLESPDCRQCTEVAAKAFSDKELGTTINQSFIPLYVNAKHQNRRWIEAEYNSPNGFGTLFIDQNGTLIHKFGGTVSAPQKYFEQIDIAFNRAGENLKVSELEKEYKNGNRSPGFFEQLLLKKNSLNLNTTSLLDEYVALLPADSLSSLYTLQFIASLAPVLGSKASNLLRKDPLLFDKAWYSFPLARRININSSIIQKSLNKAVKERDEAFAIRIASFAKATVTNSAEAKDKVYFMRLLDFYDGVDDTSKYLETAVYYYDRFLMRVNSDSVKRIDELQQQQLLNVSKKDTVRTEKGFSVKTNIVYSPNAQRFTWELKEGAWNVYKKTSSPAFLASATNWVKKALQFYQSPEALDVYAHLLYKQQQREAAIAAEKEAIDLKKKQGYSATDNEVELKLMQQGLPLSY